MTLPLEGEITSFAFGGKGILRNAEGLVVFVPFTAPGERVSYRISKKKKQYAEGELLQVLKASPHRIQPLCPYFTQCGGCQLQHLDYPYQVSLKQQSVQEALVRVYPEAKVECTPSSSEWNYRRRIHLTLKPGKDGFEAGYIATDHHSLIQVQQCPIFLPAGHPLIPQVAKIAKKLQAHPENNGKATLIKLSEEKFLVHFHFKIFPKNAEKVLKESLLQPIAGLCLSAPGHELKMGEESLNFSIGNLAFRYTPRAFIQNHPEESRHIYQTIQEDISALKPSSLLDLYSGIGITSLLASPHCHTIDAIELNREAVSLAKQNAEANSLKNIQFHQGLVEEKLGSLLKKRPEMAITNPPREGMERSACEMLASSTIKRLIYISCHPATLARDLKFFKDKGFKLETTRAFDMFPQTGHIETLVILSKERGRCPL